MKINNQHIRISWIRAIAAVITFQLSLFTSSATENFGYTKEKPLIIVCDWDFQPFEFLDNEGKPSGYNVEILDLILNKLGIPHRFVMQEWYLATQMFEKHEADLIHALYAYYNDAPKIPTKKYINYYNLKVARRLDTPPLATIGNLTAHDTLILKNNDYAALRVNEIENAPFAYEYHSPKDGLTGIRTGRYKYYIWGYVPLVSKIKELGLDSLTLDEIDIPAGELRIIGYDKDLIDIIDDEYTRLEQNGEIDIIRDKWFHPERVHNDSSPLALIILIGLAVAAIVGFLLSRLITIRVNATMRQSSDINSMMKTALNMGNYSVIEYDVKGYLLRNQYGHLLPTETMLPQEFIQRMPLEQGKFLHEMNSRLISGQQQHFEMHLRFNRGSDDHPQWNDYYGNAIAETDESGKTVSIFYTIKDITQELLEERENRDLRNKYMKVFDTNIVAMSFYDKDGNLLDLNQEMRKVCAITEEYEEYYRSVNLFDISAIKDDFTPASREPFHVCHQMRSPNLNDGGFVEMRIKPVINDNGHIVYYIITAREVTAERIM